MIKKTKCFQNHEEVLYQNLKKNSRNMCIISSVLILYCFPLSDIDKFEVLLLRKLIMGIVLISLICFSYCIINNASALEEVNSETQLKSNEIETQFDDDWSPQQRGRLFGKSMQKYRSRGSRRSGDFSDVLHYQSSMEKVLVDPSKGHNLPAKKLYSQSVISDPTKLSQSYPVKSDQFDGDSNNLQINYRNGLYHYSGGEFMALPTMPQNPPSTHRDNSINDPTTRSSWKPRGSGKIGVDKLLARPVDAGTLGSERLGSGALGSGTLGSETLGYGVDQLLSRYPGQDDLISEYMFLHSFPLL